jgi:hypothetical protein
VLWDAADPHQFKEISKSKFFKFLNENKIL